MAVGEVDHGAPQVGQLGTGAGANERPVGAHEGLLDQLVSHGVVAGEHPRETEEVVVMEAEELFEPGPLTRGRERHRRHDPLDAPTPSES